MDSFFHIQDFPWFPKPVNSLKASTASSINDEASLIWFVKDDMKNKANEILTPIATQYMEEVKKDGIENLLFYYHCDEDDEDEIGSSLRSFCGLSTDIKLVLLDIPKQKVSQGVAIYRDLARQLFLLCLRT